MFLKCIMLFAEFQGNIPSYFKEKNQPCKINSFWPKNGQFYMIFSKIKKNNFP